MNLPDADECGLSNLLESMKISVSFAFPEDRSLVKKPNVNIRYKKRKSLKRYLKFYFLMIERMR